MKKNVKKWENRKYFNFPYLCLVEWWNSRGMENFLLFGWKEKWKDRKCDLYKFIFKLILNKKSKSDEQKKKYPDW